MEMGGMLRVAGIEKKRIGFLECFVWNFNSVSSTLTPKFLSPSFLLFTHTHTNHNATFKKIKYCEKSKGEGCKKK